MTLRGEELRVDGRVLYMGFLGGTGRMRLAARPKVEETNHVSSLAYPEEHCRLLIVNKYFHWV